MNPLVDTARSVNWNALADRILGGDEVTSDEALAVLHAPDSEVPALLAHFKLDDTAKDSAIIKTIRGGGYMFCLPVTRGN